MSRCVNPRYLCPYCSKEILTQRLCSHIMRNHPSDLYAGYGAQIRSPTSTRIIFELDKKQHNYIYFTLGSQKNFKNLAQLENFWISNPLEIKLHQSECQKLAKQFDKTPLIAKSATSAPLATPTAPPSGWEKEREALMAIIGSLTDEVKLQKEFAQRFETYWEKAREEFNLTDDQYDDGDEYIPDPDDEYIGEDLDVPKLFKIKTKDCMKAYREFHKNFKAPKKEVKKEPPKSEEIKEDSEVE